LAVRRVSRVCCAAMDTAAMAIAAVISTAVIKATPCWRILVENEYLIFL
jgi:hypothetical protein